MSSICCRPEERGVEDDLPDWRRGGDGDELAGGGGSRGSSFSGGGTQVLSVVAILQDEVDPVISVMKVEKAHLESYAEIGGLDAQIQEIKEDIELPLDTS